MPEDNLSAETVKQLQTELIALVEAWADRGIAPSESAMIIVANGHMLLAKLGFSLGQIVSLLSDSWRSNNGRI